MVVLSCHQLSALWETTWFNSEKLICLGLVWTDAQYWSGYSKKKCIAQDLKSTDGFIDFSFSPPMWRYKTNCNNNFISEPIPVTTGGEAGYTMGKLPIRRYIDNLHKNVMQLSWLRSRSSDMRTQARTGKETKLSLKQKNETFTWTWVQKQGKSYRWSKQKLELGKTVTTMTKGDMNTILSRCMRGTMNMPLNRIMKKNLELGVTWREVNRWPDKDWRKTHRTD